MSHDRFVIFGGSAKTRVSVSVVELDKGLRGDARLMVTANDTAAALGSGTVDVLGSPRLIALCEQACQNAMASELEPGTTTVGMRVQFDHLQPTPVGAEVFAEAVPRRSTAVESPSRYRPPTRAA